MFREFIVSDFFQPNPDYLGEIARGAFLVEAACALVLPSIYVSKLDELLSSRVNLHM